MNKYIYIVMLTFCFSCNNKFDKTTEFKLPFNTNNVWTYEVKHYLKDAENVGSIESPIIRFGVVTDTMKIIIEKEKRFNNHVYYIFNESFNSEWYHKVVLTDSGYANFFGNVDDLSDTDIDDFILKYPVKLGYKWKKLWTELHGFYEYTAIDTAIAVNDKTYTNCIELTVMRGRFNNYRTTKFYLNEEFGLIYYSDPEMEEEIKLLKMEKANL